MAVNGGGGKRPEAGCICESQSDSDRLDVVCEIGKVKGIYKGFDLSSRWILHVKSEDSVLFLLHVR